MGFGVCPKCGGYWCSVGDYVNYCVCKPAVPLRADEDGDAVVTALMAREPEDAGGQQGHESNAQYHRRLFREAYAAGRAAAFKEALSEVRGRILGVRKSDACDAILDAAAEAIARAAKETK